jgi:hypothetical protein
VESLDDEEAEFVNKNINEDLENFKNSLNKS